ncbi:aminotransferase class V-fold PLP-dependent enzyme [Lentzea sp. BCCO 10_0856]|uniref:Aminotransferase class V-fold PLP-dependent enzyme n=1 Tax=Lentzea miocenica TaxID=3095431 RepID=A0ABU4T852_9PSEU|nr:aminotransferase class V-fold PLP-dependent enzyme [Lentzea sp. BCCO 10_0856]MDX8034137.1 aminotransferase class V-fold PLP-dependent enzyme [Lentzea sp. BCCO 10_0856]
MTQSVRLDADTLATASWESIREIFALDPGTTHLNTGTIGAMPHEVVEVYERVTREWTGSLANIYPPSLYPEYRAQIAADFGVDQDEMVICHNSTEGIARIIAGLDLGPDDEVLTTTHECFSVLSNFNLAHNRFGVKVNLVTLPSGPDVTVEDVVHTFEAALTPRTKVMAFAATTLFTGTRMPIRELCDLAQRHGVITMIDAALMPGMVDVNLRELGVDFMAGSGSKFQCGPLGTGLLYARNKVFPEHNPLPLPRFWPVISTWYPLVGDTPARTKTAVETYNMGDYLQSAGSASIARAAALAKACEIWNAIGRGRIEDRIMELGRYAKQRVAEHFGESSLYTPLHDTRLHAPLVAFKPFRAPEDAWNIKKVMAFVDRLESAHRIWIRWVEFEVPGSPHMHYAARICTHLFNSHDEIDRTLKIMAGLADEMA